MQNATYNNEKNCCDDKTNQAPVIGQSFYIFPPNYFISGLTQIAYPIFTPLIAGDIAYAAGYINNDSCYDLSLDITYLNNQNCTDCGNPSYVKSTKRFYVYANTLTELPEGYISELNMNVGIMSAGNTFNNQANITPINLEWTSSYNPSCDNPILVQ